MAYVGKIMKWSKSRGVLLPVKIHRELGWYIGDIVQFDVQGDVLLIKRLDLPKMPAVTKVDEQVEGAE